MEESQHGTKLIHLVGKEGVMTPEEKVYQIVKKFVADQRIYCSETVYQSDRVIENAYQFIEELCEVVGYRDFKEDCPDEES